MKSLILALCVVCAALAACPPSVEAGPLMRGVRAVHCNRVARHGGELPRHRVARCLLAGCCR